VAGVNWGSPAEFFAMGGYGVYVWSSFGVTALLLILEIAGLARRRRAAGSLEHTHPDEKQT
jgi:heme exporter protein D